jgi:RNA polymerase sigma factor (sigma-70 family)
VFHTTVWEVVQAAGADDPEAIGRIAEEYRAPILAFIRSRGVNGAHAEDLCQDVFVRLLAGGVLGKADAAKGRFRTLLCTVTIRVIQDWSRRHREVPSSDLDPAAPTPAFDRLWVLHLVERAFKQLKATSPRSYEVLKSHLRDQGPDRNKLWIARGKLAALLRREIALTCRSPEEVEAELACLSPYLRPSKKD